jgi:prophage regulatory protein
MELETAQNRIVRMKDLPTKIGFQPSTIYGLIAEGKFPTPHKLVPGGRAAGWFETTIEEWLKEQRKLASTKVPSSEKNAGNDQ